MEVPTGQTTDLPVDRSDRIHPSAGWNVGTSTRVHVGSWPADYKHCRGFHL